MFPMGLFQRYLFLSPFPYSFYSELTGTRPANSFSQVMPYLSRRAIENRSVLGEGGAADERKRAWDEIRRRVWRSG